MNYSLRCSAVRLSPIIIAALFLCLAGQRALAQKLDLNSNNMSDVWEELFNASSLSPSADTDGDGFSNLQEALAGTDPFDANSYPNIPVTSYTGTNFSVTLPCALGKQYTLQSIQPLTANWTNWTTEATVVARSGTNITLSAPVTASSKLFRVAISDIDSDGDGLNDWEEYQLGLDPLDPMSNGQLDPSFQPYNDYAYAAARFASQNVVTITATDPAAFQPDSGQPANNPGIITVARGGFPLRAISVNLSPAGAGSGFAVPGVDFTALPTSISLPAGVSSQNISVVPLANPNRLVPLVTTLSLLSGTGYTIGTPATASVTIYPTATATGTGLTGQYYTNSSATYSSSANFNAANLKLTRVDTNVDFNWGSTNYLPITNSGYYSIRWTGQVIPQYSETYYFVANTDDGVKLWVNDQLIIDTWITRGAADSVSTPINLVGGLRYNIKMEYFNGGGGGVAHLSWYSLSQPKQPIPMGRLYPGTPTAPSSVTSALFAYAFLNQPFTYNVTGANTPTRYGASPLPPGLAFNTTSGLLSGTPTLAGDFQIMVTSSNTLGVGSAVLDLQVIDTGSSLMREVWTAVPGTNISDIPLSVPANVTNVIGSLEGITDYGDDYGERVRGYLTAPTTANYYFWIAGSDSAELWISNDEEPNNKVLRARVSPANPTAPRQWTLDPSQKSGWLALQAGQRYYVEVLHKAGAGTNDNWSVGWLQDPTGTNNTPAGLAPSYLLSRFYPLPPTFIPGTLYAANMLPEAGVVSSGNGSATLRVNAAGTQATLKFSYANLTSPLTGKHIHADAYLNHTAGEIIFDIDDATPQPDGSYVWNIVPIGTYTSTADILEAIRQGKTYINLHTVNHPAGEINGHFTLAEGTQVFIPPPPPPLWTDDHSSSNAASRFLIQATFGPSPAEIQNVINLGYEGWIDNQIALPVSHHLPVILAKVNSDPTLPYPETTVFNTWWQQSVTAPDQLRQRVAFALSEIMVVSAQGVLSDNGRALSDYYDTLLDYSFGNYRELLEAVTLSPAMGLYLDMRANDKGNLASGTHANENYAREIMQLFSIGLYRMWPDGQLILDSTDSVVPTYGQNEIMGMAAVFTGWNYWQPLQGNGRLPTNFGPPSNYTNQMVLVPTHHDLGAKRLLDNVMIPAAQGSYADSNSTNYDIYGLQDLEKAHDSIFFNENVGPFICRQLIQRLVTSNPSRDYLYRVVQKFKDNGLGVRGDMKAVIKAILLDYEARGPVATTDPTFGKEREPLLRVTGVARALPAPADLGGVYTNGITQTVTVTTTNAHRLNSGDTVLLGFADGSGATAPPSQSFSVTVTSPTGLTINAPGMLAGTYTQIPNTTVSNMVIGANVTTNAIVVTATGHGLTFGNPVYLQFNGSGTYAQRPNITISNMVDQTIVTTNIITVTSANHGLSFGTTVYLEFTSGAALNGYYQIVTTSNANSFIVIAQQATSLNGNVVYNPNGSASGMYQIVASSNANSFVVVTPDASSRSGNVLIPRFTGGGFIVASRTNLTISTSLPHGLHVGDSVFVNFTQAGSPADNTFQVAAVPDATHFTCYTATNNNQTQDQITVYPLVAPPLNRSGSVVVDWNTWNIGTTDSSSSGRTLGQTPLNSPTVFNFFFPGYMFPGILGSAGLTTPEFQLTSDTTSMWQMNYLQGGIIAASGGNANNTNGLTSFDNGNGSIVLDIGPWMTQGFTANAANVGSLVDQLNTLLCAGQLSSTARTQIINYVANVSYYPYGSPPTYAQMRDRVRAVVHLIINSPEYTIQR
jgi:hypothetical protein